MIELKPHQLEVIDKLGNGKILYGGVGTGKTVTALAYYQKYEAPKDIVVITTAKKRDDLDWEGEAARFGISVDPEITSDGALLVESWNNISKFVDYEGYFFIFDEQRLVGSGAWVKSFIKIAQKNNWIMLSATPGDTWVDYAPVFIANGYYKNITDFRMQHVVYDRHYKFPKIKGYINEHKLNLLRNEVLVEMFFMRHTERILNYLDVDYEQELFDLAWKKRWNPYEDQPIRDIAELFRVARRIVNCDPSRVAMIRKLLTCHDRMIIFYNFNYELELLRELSDTVSVYELNGHKKDPLPTEEKWVYLVQYVAGAEAWNCTTTNAMVFYSLTYSFKHFEQSQGRIDRLNTPYEQLYYYILASNSKVDVAVRDALAHKRAFNEREFARGKGEFRELLGSGR